MVAGVTSIPANISWAPSFTTLGQFDIGNVFSTLPLLTAILVIFTIMLGTTFRTVRQVKEIRARNRAEKLEREVADMKMKASMLQTKMSSSPDEISPVGSEDEHDRI